MGKRGAGSIPVAAGEEAGRPGPGGGAAGVEARSRLRHAAPPPRSPLRPTRQARIHPDAAPARRLPGTAGGGRGARRGEAAPDRLRCRQAPAAGPHREAARASRTCRAIRTCPSPSSPPRGAPTTSPCRPEGPAMVEPPPPPPPHPARASPEEIEAADLPAGIRETGAPVRGRGPGSCAVPRPAGGAGADRLRAASTSRAART